MKKFLLTFLISSALSTGIMTLLFHDWLIGGLLILFGIGLYYTAIKI